MEEKILKIVLCKTMNNYTIADYNNDDYKNIEIYEFQYPNCPKCNYPLNRSGPFCENCGWNQP